MPLMLVALLQTNCPAWLINLKGECMEAYLAGVNLSMGFLGFMTPILVIGVLFCTINYFFYK